MRNASADGLGLSIQVEARAGLPHRVVWGGRPFRVMDVEAIWCVEGKWWLDRAQRGARRRYFRLSLRAPDGTTRCVEVYQQSALWKLWRVAD